MSKKKCLDQVIHDASSRIFSVEAGCTAYGEMSTFSVLALRLGKKVLLTAYHHTRQSYGRWEDTEAGFGITDRIIAAPEDVPGEIARLVDGFEDPDIDTDVAGAVAKLPDSTRRFGALIDRRYAPTEGVLPAKPSRLIRAVFSGEVACEAPCWAWFDGTLHLTACRFVWKGGPNRQVQFDDSLGQICVALGLKTENLFLGPEDDGGDFIRKVRFWALAHRRASLAWEVSQREAEITTHRQDIARCRLEIAARRERLGAMDERLASFKGGRGHE